MNRIGKQRSEVKRLLKQKLINYQNQIKKQSQIIIYDGVLTSRSEKMGLFNCLKSSFQTHTINKQNQKQYLAYLNQPTSEEDLFVKKSLTRQNILALNKKGRIIRSSLKQLSKKKSSIQNIPSAFASLQMSQSLSPVNQQKGLFPQKSEMKQKALQGLLTIKKSKKQQLERPYQYIRKSISQQNIRRKIYSSSRPVSSQKERPKTSLNPQTQNEKLTQYFTPAYHKQTKSGYIINDFQPRIKAKHFEDNIKVMATLIKKKISNSDQPLNVVEYVKKIGNKNYQTPNSKIQQLVRKNNEQYSKRKKVQQKVDKNKKSTNKKVLKN